MVVGSVGVIQLREDHAQAVVRLGIRGFYGEGALQCLAGLFPTLLLPVRIPKVL